MAFEGRKSLPLPVLDGLGYGVLWLYGSGWQFSQVNAMISEF